MNMNKTFDLNKTPIFEKKLAKILKKNPLLKNKVIKFLETLATDPKYPSLKSHQVNHSEYGKI